MLSASLKERKNRSLHTDPIFVANIIIFSVLSFIVHAHSFPSDNSDRLLCPLLALKYYLERARNQQDGKKRLEQIIIIISYTDQPGNIIKNVLTHWILATIKLAYVKEFFC